MTENIQKFILSCIPLCSSYGIRAFKVPWPPHLALPLVRRIPHLLHQLHLSQILAKTHPVPFIFTLVKAHLPSLLLLYSQDPTLSDGLVMYAWLLSPKTRWTSSLAPYRFLQKQTLFTLTGNAATLF